MKVGITGAAGLLAYHLRIFLKALGGCEVRLAERDTFQSDSALDRFVCDVDAVVHLAGMNRGEDAEVEAVNPWLAEKLTAAFRRTATRPVVIYSNSTHIDRETPYGRGKRAAASHLEQWARAEGANFLDLVLPNVFGEFGRPFYNSAVSTFCHQLAHGEEPRIHQDGVVELVHAQDVAWEIWEALGQARSGKARMAGTPMQVSVLLDRLRQLHGSYSAHVMPSLENPLDRRLFNTLRSYMFPTRYPVALTLHGDSRGSLFEAVKTRGGGQTFMSSTHPGITRGNHFHLRKVERFLVVAGQAEIRLRRIFTNEVHVFAVSGTTPCYIDMPTCHTHSITNTGNQELVTLFWANEIFDPADSDTYAEPVLQ